MSGHELAYSEPEKVKSIDAEYLAGRRFPYQEDISLFEDVDLEALTPGEDLKFIQQSPVARGQPFQPPVDLVELLGREHFAGLL